MQPESGKKGGGGGQRYPEESPVMALFGRGAQRGREIVTEHLVFKKAAKLALLERKVREGEHRAPTQKRFRAELVKRVNNCAKREGRWNEKGGGEDLSVINPTRELLTNSEGRGEKRLCGSQRTKQFGRGGERKIPKRASEKRTSSDLWGRSTTGGRRKNSQFNSFEPSSVRKKNCEIVFPRR